MTAALPQYKSMRGAMAHTIASLCLVALLVIQPWTGVYAQTSNFAAAVKPIVGVGNVGTFTRPVFQLPIAEKNVATVTWQPSTVYRPTVEVRRLGFCVPRQQWQVQGAIADRCPANTYMNTINGQSVCTQTLCAGPVGATNKKVTVPQQATSQQAYSILRQLQNQPQQWGANVASVCRTLIVKPIMTCPENCIPDTRNAQADNCICPNGWVPCPYNYQPCTCDPSPYTLCVADSYYCPLYCNYLPTWIPAMVNQGTYLCPIDPNTIDFTQASGIYPGWSLTNAGRRLRNADISDSSSSSANSGSSKSQGIWATAAERIMPDARTEDVPQAADAEVVEPPQQHVGQPISDDAGFEDAEDAQHVEASEQAEEAEESVDASEAEQAEDDDVNES